MSSSFGNKNNNKEEDTSFYSFLAGILILFVIYYFIVILKKIFYEIPFNNSNKYINCHCSKCIKRYEEYKLKIKRKNINAKLLINVLLFFLFVYLFISCCQRVKSKEIFDPYEILEISPTDSLSKIKKSYKKLSLKYHPDKNKDKSSKEIFMNINKAYKILTNEKAKENFYKYGNPDGPSVLTIGLALPFFLFEGQSGYYFLIFFSFLILIVFPIIFIKWFKKRNKYNDNGFILDNLPIYYKLINNNISITELPFIIGCSLEFNEINIEYNKEDIKNIFDAFKPYFPKNYKNKVILSINNMHAIAVLYIHFSGSEIVIKNNKFMNVYIINKDKIIEKSIFLIDELIKTVFELNRIYEFEKGIKDFLKEKEFLNKNNLKDIEKYGIKDFNIDLLLMLLKFKSCIYHETNIKINYYELLQFPDNKKNIQTFIENNYISINDLIIKNNELEWLNKLDNYKDIKEIISIMPIYNINLEMKNTRFEEAGNLITFDIVLKKDNKSFKEKNQKQLGFLHSNIYSDNYEEQAFIIIFDVNNKRINYFEKIKFEFLVEEKKIEYNMLTELNGKNNFRIYLISTSYPGLIIDKEIEIDINEENNLYNNFVKNRVRNVLSVEEFQENYGLLNDEDYDDIHKHIN